MSFQLALVTRLPDHECASSCATRLTSERSPTITVGVAKVSRGLRSEEHTSELQSPMRNSYAVLRFKKTNHRCQHRHTSRYPANRFRPDSRIVRRPGDTVRSTHNSSELQSLMITSIT